MTRVYVRGKCAVRGSFVVARWMDGGGETSRLTSAVSVFRAMDKEREDQCERAQHLRQSFSGLFTARGICLRTLRIYLV